MAGEAARADLRPGRSTVEAAPVVIDRAAVAVLKARIDLHDRMSLATYGDDAMREVAEFSDSVLRQTLGKDSGSIGDTLGHMLDKLRGLDPSTLKEAGWLQRLTGEVQRRVDRFRRRFVDVASEVDGIAIRLEQQRDGLHRDIAMLDQLYEANLSQLANLDAAIQAGREVGQHAETVALPEARARAASAAGGPDAQLAAQAVQDLAQAAERLGQKIDDLLRSRTIGQQMAVQIRMIQGADDTLADRLGTSINTTIPVWKNAMTIALALHHQGEALKLQKAVTDTTNEMLARNAERLKQGTIEIAKETQRGVVDIATLEKVNRDMIDTISEVVAIQGTARARRQDAEARMRVMEADMRKALLQAKRPPGARVPATSPS